MDDALFSGILAGGVIVGFMCILFILCLIGTKIDEKYEAEDPEAAAHEARRLSIQNTVTHLRKSRHGSQSPLVKKCEPTIYTIGGDNPGFENEVNGSTRVTTNGEIHSYRVNTSPLKSARNGALDSNGHAPSELNGTARPRQSKSMREFSYSNGNDVLPPPRPKFVKSHSVQGDYCKSDLDFETETTFGVHVETIRSPKRKIPIPNGNNNNRVNNNIPNGVKVVNGTASGVALNVMSAANNGEASNGNILKGGSFENQPIPEDENELIEVTTDLTLSEVREVTYNPDGKDNQGRPHCPRKTRRKYQTQYSNQNSDILL